MNGTPNGAATVIGSFPHATAEEACGLVFDSLRDIPAWPQLPRRNYFEDMNVQFSRRLPCFSADPESRKAGFDTSRDMAGELERFYTKVIEDDVEYFGLDDEHAAGFGRFTAGVRDGKAAGAFALKGETSGPLTLGLMTDATDGKYALYKPDLFDAIVKSCTMNARWQARTLKKLSGSGRAIVFFDEPSLSIIGSGFYSVDRSQIAGSFREIIQGIHAEGGLAGTHCCGNADWDELLDPALDLDIINFDATDEIIVDKFLNAGRLASYLERGKWVAWGVVPTLKDKIEAATPEAVSGFYHAAVARLVKKGVREDVVRAQTIVTPSCGTGTLPVPLAEKVMTLLAGLSRSLK